MIVAVFGLPGSGKSYLATFLKDQLDAVYISSDSIRRALFPEQRSYSPQEKEQVYAEMLKQMNEGLEKNSTTILDATFSSAKIRARFNSAAIQNGKSIIWVESWVEEEKTLARLSKPRQFSEANIDVFNLIKSQFDPMEEDHIKFHSENDSPKDLLRQLKHHE